MPVQIAEFILGGGIDLETPYLALKPGRCIDAVNYEVRPAGGYRRIDGYLKYDGQASAAAAVPGSGPIRGVNVFQNVGYAFRDNAGASACQMWKATSGGWVLQSLGSYLKFTSGTTDAEGDSAFVEGVTVTGATSGATATIRRIAVNDGTGVSGTLVGLLVLTGIVGTFQNGENLQTGGVTRGVANGTVVAITLPAGGDYRFANENFLASASSQRMYGANGVGYAFEWDGTYFTPILQQIGTTYPSVIFAHQDHLMLGSSAGILRTSGTGLPLDYRSVKGSSDIGIGDAIVDFVELLGGVLGIGCATKSKLLYGSNVDDWDVKPYSDSGVRARTMKTLGDTAIVLDKRGVQRLDQTASFGDFASLSMSVPINKRLLPIVQLNAASAAAISKNKDQYRLFFGKQGYYFSFNAGRLAGIMPVQYLDDVLNVAEGEDTSGAEMILFGSQDGNVFRMNVGYKFDTANVQASFQLAYWHDGKPSLRKHGRKAVFFIESEGASAQLQGRAFFSLGGDPAIDLVTLLQQAGGASWDAEDWDTFDWGNEYGSEISLELNGTGLSMSVAVYSAGTENGLHTIQSAVYHWTPRRLQRTN